jgi:hypothetical protein
MAWEYGSQGSFKKYVTPLLLRVTRGEFFLHDCWDQFLLPKFSFLFYFPNFFFFIYFPSSTPTLTPLFFYPFSFAFLATMLSRISKKISTGSRVGGLAGLHLHPCSYVMSPTNHLVIIYLTIFATVGSWVQASIFQVLQSPFCTQRPMI